MDNSFSFLSDTHSDLLNVVLARRNPALSERVRQDNIVSRSDAEDIVALLIDEFLDNLDDDWEPTDYGRTVSAVMTQFNDARISQWP